MVAAIQAFQKQVEAPTRVGASGFIRTRLSKTIEERCDRARKRRKILFVYGPSQIGKTESLVEYTRTHNHGETVMVEMPTKPSLHSFKGRLCPILALSQTHRAGELDKNIFDAFDPSVLLIIDEAHRALHVDRGWLVLDFIREIYNRCGCGIVISMTDEGRDLFHRGPHAVRLKQLWNRRLAPLQLPKVLPADDLDLFSTAHNLPPAPDEQVTVRYPFIDGTGAEKTKEYSESPFDLQQRVVANEGLGVWVTILQDACDMAEAQKRQVTWAAVLKSYCVSQADAECWQ